MPIPPVNNTLKNAVLYEQTGECFLKDDARRRRMDEKATRVVRAGLPQSGDPRKAALLLVGVMLLSLMQPVSADTNRAQDDFGVLDALAATLDRLGLAGHTFGTCLAHGQCLLKCVWHIWNCWCNCFGFGLGL